jgi:hypothetical protein
MNGRTPAETITAFDYEGTDNTTLDGKLLAYVAGIISGVVKPVDGTLTGEFVGK